MVSSDLMGSLINQIKIKNEGFIVLDQEWVIEYSLFPENEELANIFLSGKSLNELLDESNKLSINKANTSHLKSVLLKDQNCFLNLFILPIADNTLGEEQTGFLCFVKYSISEIHLSSERDLFIQKIIELMPVRAFILETETMKVVWANSDLYDELGFPLNSAASSASPFENLNQIIHEDDYEQLSKGIKYLQNCPEGTIYESEVRVADKNREWHWWHYTATSFHRDTDGKVVQIIGIVKDITAQKKTEISLKESQLRLERMIASAMDGIIIINGLDQIVMYNNAAQGMFGHTSDQIVGKPIQEIFPSYFKEIENSFEKLLADIGLSTKEGEIQPRTIQGKRSDGELFPVNVSISHLKVNEEDYYTIIARDITEKKEVIEALQKSQSNFKSLFNNIPQLFLILDNEGKIIEFNKTAYKVSLFFWKRILRKKDSLAGYLEGENVKTLWKNLAKAFQGESISVFREIPTPTGEVIYFKVKSGPIYNDKGEIECVSLSAIDVSESIALERERKDLNEMMDFMDEVCDSLMIKVNAQGDILFMNGHAQAIVNGLDDPNAFVFSLMQQALSQHKQGNPTSPFQIPTPGVTQEMQWWSRPVYDENGQLMHMLFLGKQ